MYFNEVEHAVDGVLAINGCYTVQCHVRNGTSGMELRRLTNEISEKVRSVFGNVSVRVQFVYSGNAMNTYTLPFYPLPTEQ